MAKTFRLPKDEPLLNIASYARGGSRADGNLTPWQIDQIRRTVRRDPEALLKVLPKGSSDLNAIDKHLDYISRRGKLELEGDNGENFSIRAGKELLEDWDLDIDDLRRQSDLTAGQGRVPEKIAHKMVFSMPPGTPPQKVLLAVRNFAREEFWGKHRYALVLHVDEAHPHVHFVLKAVSEQGKRLNIRKATLREWRMDFARHLRLLGVRANATERAVRGQDRKSKKDGIYRAAIRGKSSYLREQAESVARELAAGRMSSNAGYSRLVQTRHHVLKGWSVVANRLKETGQERLAGEVTEFLRSMPVPKTDRGHVASSLRVHLRDGAGHPRRRVDPSR
jgi:hypothetical protein